MFLTPLRALLAVPALALALAMAAAPARSDPAADRLAAALGLPDILLVMEEEGKVYGQELEDGMFPGQGGRSWNDAVARIYDADRVLPVFRAGFDAALAKAPALTGAMTAFFEGDTGKKAVVLEISARRALLDQAVEDASRLKYEDLKDAKDPRLAMVNAFIAANDLIDSNVTGGLNANLAFYKGLAAAGGFHDGMSETDMVEDVWSQEPALRSETTAWLTSFLLMAYAPLSDAELQAYIDFSRSPAGAAMNAALFAGFDAVFADVSGRLGAAAGAFVAGHDL